MGRKTKQNHIKHKNKSTTPESGEKREEDVGDKKSLERKLGRRVGPWVNGVGEEWSEMGYRI